MQEYWKIITANLKLLLPTNHSAVFFLAIVLIFTVVIIFYRIRNRRYFERLTDKENWNMFHQFCETAEISSREGALLKKWALSFFPKKPQNILKSIELIERISEKEEESLEDLPEKRVAFSGLIDNIRQKLYYHIIPEYTLNSTRDLKPGKRVIAGTEMNGKQYRFESEIIANTRTAVKITLPADENNLQFEQNYPIELSIVQPDYSVDTFETEIKKYEKNAIVLNQSGAKTKTNRYHYFRIKTDIWGRYSKLSAFQRNSIIKNKKFEKEWISRSLTCKVISISRGGAALLVREQCSVDDILWITFSLNDKLFIGDPVGRVLRIKEMNDGMYKVFIEFIHLSESDSHALIRYLSSKLLSKNEINKALRRKF